MNRMSKIASGIPLRQTNPASVERFLIEKVREDLGEFRDLATIKPILQVDSEDGDLSGNLTDAFGTVMLTVQGQPIHIPFIIHQKELIPFDVIRMGEQEVAYDPSKLRRIVNGVDKQIKEKRDAEGSVSDSVEGVVSPKDIQSNNGFLGTIMSVRDEEAFRGTDMEDAYAGGGFGHLDDGRLLAKGASADVDIFSVFHETMEKIAHIKTYTPKMVDEFLHHIEKKAESESQKAIDQASDVSIQTIEGAGVQRSVAKLKEEKLVDLNRVASGNDIKFPIADQGRFEYRNGRVYHKVEPLAVNEKREKVSPVASLVIDAKGGYKILKPTDKFMTTLESPVSFDIKMEHAKGLQEDKLYAMEINEDTASHPFTVIGDHNQDLLHDGMFIKAKDRETNTLFHNAYRCKEVMPAKYQTSKSQTTSQGYGYVTNREFAILILRNEEVKEVAHLTEEQLEEFIQTHAKDPADAKLARYMAKSYVKDYYVVPMDYKFFKLEHNITGNFTRPDGYFKEGPLVKTAAYNDMNKVTLKVEKNNQPKVYGLEWQFIKEQGTGDTKTSSVQQRKHSGLSEAQARKMLANLGFDHRRQEMFFEITKRNGREATMRLPDKNRASQTSPRDRGQQKREKAKDGLIKTTFNAQNFMPIFEDAIAEGIAGTLANTVPQSVSFAKKWNEWFKEAFDTAVDIEKIASELNGPTWHELSAMTNLKYQLDKIANDVIQGCYVAHANEVFEKVAELQPVIQKHASNLIDFNRKQLLQYNRPIVHPSLVKRALHQLDGLYKYASFAQQGEQNANFNVAPLTKVSAEGGAAQEKTASDQEIPLSPTVQGGIVGPVAGAGIGALAGLRKGWKGSAAGAGVGYQAGDYAGTGAGVAYEYGNQAIHPDEPVSDTAKWTAIGGGLGLLGGGAIGGAGGAVLANSETAQQGFENAQNKYLNWVGQKTESPNRVVQFLADKMPTEVVKKINPRTAGMGLAGLGALAGLEVGSETGFNVGMAREIGEQATEKLANFNPFKGYTAWRSTQRQVGSEAEKNIALIQEGIAKVKKDLRDAYIEKRVMINQGIPDSTRMVDVDDRITGLETDLHNLESQMKDHRNQLGTANDQLANVDFGMSAAVGIPASFGGAYGYHAVTEE